MGHVVRLAVVQCALTANNGCFPAAGRTNADNIIIGIRANGISGKQVFSMFNHLFISNLIVVLSASLKLLAVLPHVLMIFVGTYRQEVDNDGEDAQIAAAAVLDDVAQSHRRDDHG